MTVGTKAEAGYGLQIADCRDTLNRSRGRREGTATHGAVGANTADAGQQGQGQELSRRR